MAGYGYGYFQGGVPIGSNVNQIVKILANYKTLVEADGGTVESESSTEDYISFLVKHNLFNKCKIIIWGEGGYQKADISGRTRLRKVYSIDSESRHLTQTTDSYTPYALNDIVSDSKMAIYSPTIAERWMSFNDISFNATDKWVIAFAIAPDGVINQVIGKTDYYSNFQIDVGQKELRLSNDIVPGVYAKSGLNSITKGAEIVNSVFHIVANGDGTVNLYQDAINIGTLNIDSTININTLFKHQPTTFFKGAMSFLRVQEGTMTNLQITQEVALFYDNYEKLQSVNIDGYRYSLFNASQLVADGNVLSNIHYHNSSAYRTGYLYEKTARDIVVTNPPMGFHVATKEELLYLTQYPGSALKNLKTWITYNGITQNNSTKFSAVAGGYRDAAGTYVRFGGGAYIWCADTDEVLYLDYTTDVAQIIPAVTGEEYSIRFIKDFDYTMYAISPPYEAGDNNNHALLGDIGEDNSFYFYGTSDKTGRFYKSIDEGANLIKIFDVEETYDVNCKGTWGIRVLSNNELFVIVTCLEGDEKHTRAFVSSDNQTLWNQVKTDLGSDFEMTHYVERDAEEAITFEVYGRLIDGWGFDAYENYVLITEYGYGSGTSTEPYKNTVGHMITGKVWLSEDYGATFKQVFDYINPPANITFNTTPQGHHSHGCFIDKYKLTAGSPRIVGMMGDAERRIVYSDDLGATWSDNRATLNDYQNSVCGIALQEGYLTGTDAIIRNGIQYVSRNFDATAERFSVVRSFETNSYPGSIIYVGGNFYKRDNFIVSFLTPESITRYNDGARGCIVLSKDNGVTWEKIWTDNIGALMGITSGRIMIAPDGVIWFRHADWPKDFNDGLGLAGRMIKIVV